MGATWLARGAVQPALPQAPAHWAAVRFGGRRPRRNRRGDHLVPRPCRRPTDRRLFSYPVHPPGKPERPRTEHLPDITAPTVFTHGTSDPFGTPAEVRDAAAMIAAPTEVVEIAGARHDLRSKSLDVAALAVDAALRLLR
jgi:pimeloyl-ACP methyl ester carboxylesterase